MRQILRPIQSARPDARRPDFLARTARHFQEPNSNSSWGAPAKFFHWLVAALIFIQFVLGWLAVGWHLSPTKLDLFVWHKSIGLVILVLVFVRLVWRLLNPTPELPLDTPVWERAAARVSHALLYVVMIVMPMTGWLIQSAAGVPFRIFWQIPLPSLVSPDMHTAELAAMAHLSLGIAFTALLVLHIGAALRHHFVKRNNVLTRMLPAGRSSR